MASISLSIAPFRFGYKLENERMLKSTKNQLTINEVQPLFGAKIVKGCLIIDIPDMDEALALTKRESIAFAKWIHGKVK